MIEKLKSMLSGGRKCSLLENILLCMVITLAGSFLYFDAHYFFMGFYRVLVTVLIFMVWAVCATNSGKRKQWGFLVFSVLYWLLPLLMLLYYPTRDNMRDYNKYLNTLYKFSEVVFYRPFEAIARYFGAESYAFIIALAAVVGVAFYLGVCLSDNSKTEKKTAIPEVREENGDDESEGASDEREDYEEDDDSDDFGDYDDLNSYLNSVKFDD